jgi:acyl-CoA thioesterase FadM
MNNGKYLSIMDLARLDLLSRSGFGKKMRHQGFYPVVSAETIRFRKSLKPFKKFYIQTQFLGWDEKSFFLEQTFINGEVTYARALVIARILHKSGNKISAPDAMKAVGEDSVSPPLPDYLLNWVATSEL